jgi:hypothetical protein
MCANPVAARQANAIQGALAQEVTLGQDPPGGIKVGVNGLPILIHGLELPIHPHASSVNRVRLWPQELAIEPSGAIFRGLDVQAADHFLQPAFVTGFGPAAE